MAKDIWILLVLFITTFHTYCANAQEYIVGGDSDYAPFSFIDKSGKASGLDIDILKAVSAEGKIKFNYQLTSWDSALAHIESGKIDIITGIIFSEERERFVDFTTPIHTEYYSIFIRKDLVYNDLSNLKGYRLAVLGRDFSIEKYLIPMGLYSNYTTVNSFPEALANIEKGKSDYAIVPHSLGMNEIEKNGYKNIKIEGSPILPSIYCIAVRNGNTQLLNTLNENIAALRRNGKMSDLLHKWKVYPQDESSYNQIAKYVLAILIIAVLLLVFVFIWGRSLRIQIKKKTESLNQKNMELQKSEEKFRIITENSSDVLWHIDRNFVVTYISPADERIRGYKQQEVVGTYLWAILKPEGINLLKTANKNRMVASEAASKLSPAIYEMEQLCKDGRWIWVESTATPYYDTEGTITGYHGVSRDISERKKNEQALKESEIQLKALNATKDKLFSIIAHDLRTPFNAIIGFSRILGEHVKNGDIGEIEEYADIINKSSQNAMGLLSNLMEWALSQTGRMIFSPKRLDVNSLINNNIEFYTEIANQKSITLRNSANVPVFVDADKAMINTVLRNLSSNAIKFTSTGGTILLWSQSAGSETKIAVQDSGVGLSQAAIEKLFRLDTLESTCGTQNEKGTGLGLVLCKEFIEKHQGHIGVESELGKGSVFFFTLPSSAN